MQKKPEVIVFAGPNGSGKTTVTRYAKVIPPYINADDIQHTLHCTNLEAAQKADSMRRELINRGEGFTFETVLSTDRNLQLLQYAKEKGYFIRCVYVLTVSKEINLLRVKSRAAVGGHDVPEEKIKSRYDKCLELLPRLIALCDICHIYDNTEKPVRIFKKHKDKNFYWESSFWNKESIAKLIRIEDLQNRGY